MIMFHVLPTCTSLRGGGSSEFFQVQEPIYSEKAGFLHISLRKFQAVLLPRGSLGIEGPIEGLQIF